MKKYLIILLCSLFVNVAFAQETLEDYQREKIARLEEDIDKQKKELAEKEKEIKKLSGDTTKLSKNMAKLNKKYANYDALKKERDSLQTVLKKRQDLQAEIEKQGAELLLLRNEKGKADSLSHSRLNELEGLKREHADLQQAQNDTVTALNKIRDEMRDIQNRLAQAAQTASDCKNEADSLKDKNSTLEAENERLTADVKEKSLQIEKEGKIPKTIADETEADYKAVMARSWQQLDSAEIALLAKQCSLLTDIKPDFAVYRDNLLQLNNEIAAIRNAEILLDKKYDAAQVTSGVSVLSGITASKSATVNQKAKAVKTGLEKYKTAWNGFNDMLDAIKDLDNDKIYSVKGIPLYDRQHLEEIQKLIKGQERNCAPYPFLRNKLRDVEELKKRDVHKNVSEILDKDITELLKIEE
jgi:regulator of replication initiation timing